MKTSSLLTGLNSPETVRIKTVAAESSFPGNRYPEAWVADSPAHWQSQAVSNVGKVRKLNEDAYLERADIGLWAVADGMGGHRAGDIASQTVVVELNEISENKVETLAELTAKVAETLRKANARLLDFARDTAGGELVGSTVVVMTAVAEQCAAIWSGDSRLYRYREEVLTQLTTDHSLVNDMIAKGEASRTELNKRKISNVITRAVGVDPELQFEKIYFTAEKGDLCLLCSDGLSGEVKDNEISQLLAETGFPNAAGRLVDLALNRQAKDNITVVMVACQ